MRVRVVVMGHQQATKMKPAQDRRQEEMRKVEEEGSRQA
jgi:hypothetical protein